MPDATHDAAHLFRTEPQAMETRYTRRMAAGSISAVFARGLLAQAKALGLSVSGLVDWLPASADDDGDARLSLEQMRAIWTELAARSGDEDLGLRMAQELAPGMFSALDYAVRNSATLGDAYACMTRYNRVLHSGVTVVLRVEGDEASLAHHQSRGATRHATEWAVATWLVIGRQLVGRDWVPRRVEFEHPRPARVDAHERLFRAPLVFSADRNAVVFDRELLAAPVHQADPQLRQLLEQYALRKLAALVPASTSVADRARSALMRAFASSGDFRLDTIADQLGVSARTLQRQIRQEGHVSYQQLVDATRRDLALRYLKESTISIGEAAFLLGFSEPSAFHRAFKRWTGGTPQQFRRAQGQSG